MSYRNNKTNKIMSIFDCVKKTKHNVKVNDKDINYICEHYPELQGFHNEYYVMSCPKSFQNALRSIYGKKYGVDTYDKTHISFTDNSGAFELASEIEKAKTILSKYHKNQAVYSLSYDKDYDPTLVIICDDYDRTTPTYLVNHKDKLVSPIHGYTYRGAEYSKKYGYAYKNE